MGVVRRIVAVILAFAALSVGFHSIAGEIYGAYLPDWLHVWDYLNWLAAFGMAAILVFQFGRKRALDRQHGDSVSFSYLSTNFLLYAAIFLALWFFANWFAAFGVGDNRPGAVRSLLWISFNALFPVLGGLTAWQLWRGRDNPGEAAGVPGR